MNSHSPDNIKPDATLADRVAAGVEAREIYREYMRHLEESSALAQAGELKLPCSALWITITENCNLKCIGCWREGLFKKVYTEVEEIRELLRASAGQYEVISLTDGEAFLHPKFCDILEACREFHSEATIFVISNGTIAIKGRFREAVALIDRLGLSIDGSTAETYESVRRGANFARFIENVRDIVAVRRETGFPRHIGFSFTVTRINLPELAGVVRIAHELGVDEVYAQVMEIKHPDIAERISDIHLDTMPREQVLWHMSEARETARALGVAFSFADALNPAALAHSPAGPPDAGTLFEEKVETELAVRMCQYPWTGDFSLVREGDRYNVWPCCYMEKEVAPKLAERYGLSYDRIVSVEEIFNSPPYWALRRGLAKGKLADICGDCAAAKSYPWRKRR
jgi:MoaA/NifB/PqqE/SkfB family radical SAM enzyme